MIDGVNLTIGGRDFTVPPLNLKALKKLTPTIQSIVDAGDDLSLAQLDAIVDVVHTALARNYPDLSRDEVEELLDVVNMEPTIRAVLEASGLTKRAPGEAASPKSSTGPGSTDS